MLILTRTVGASITIGDSITVTVLGIEGKQARIGIEAPRHVQIVRDDAKSGPKVLGVDERLEA